MPLAAGATLELRHTRRRLYPAEGHTIATTRPRPPGARSQIIGPLAVGGDVEPLALLFLGNPQTDQALDDVEGDEGHHRGPHEHQAHRLQLNDELLPDAGVAARARDPVDRGAGAAE